MTPIERKFIRDLGLVSAALAIWAQDRISDGWSVEDIKLHLRVAGKLAGRK